MVFYSVVSDSELLFSDLIADLHTVLEVINLTTPSNWPSGIKFKSRYTFKQNSILNRMNWFHPSVLQLDARIGKVGCFRW